MKIYAIKDRLLEYYMTPFAAESDKEVLAGISTIINKGEIESAIAQAPHHYEIWRIGEVDEEGLIVPGKEFLADGAALVRGRPSGGDGRNGEKHPGSIPTIREGALGRPAGGRETAPQGTSTKTNTPPRDPENTTQGGRLT